MSEELQKLSIKYYSQFCRDAIGLGDLNAVLKQAYELGAKERQEKDALISYDDDSLTGSQISKAIRETPFNH